MKHTATIVSILLALLVSCTDKSIYYSISGSGVAPSDTLYLYGLDRSYEYMDTILADEDGNFEYEIYADTVFPLSLLMPTGEALVMYAEPSIKATITPDTIQKGKWHINGGKLQHTYDSIAARLEKLPAGKHFEEIDSFIRREPMNEAGIMLIRRYIIESSEPNNRNIRNILTRLGGKLNDNDYIKDIQKLIEQKRSTNTIRYTSVPAFNFVTIDDSIQATNSRYKDKFLILNFWASWDTLSCKHVKEMSCISKRYSPEELMMLNISLDHDTAQWRKKIYTDSILGDNVCDQKMWDNNLVKKYDINNLPYSVLINPYLLNINYNTTPEKLSSSLDSIIDLHKKEKEKNDKRRKNKK